MSQLLNYTSIRMVEGMKSVSEQNAKMTEEMKELAMKNAEATKRMKELAELSSEATTRMAELAEVNRQQAAQGAHQAKSMADLAYDTKRDSEVMKAVTLVTLIFLPATFVAVGPIPRQEFPAYSVVLLQTVFSMGFLKFDQGQVSLSDEGRVFLVCTLPLTVIVLGVSFGWIIWTGKKVEKPDDYSVSQVLAQAADTLRLGAGPSKHV
jgi:hypothetical protein